MPETTRPITFVSRVEATMNSTAKSTKANTRLTAGPAAIATSRRQVAWRQYASGASAHSSSCQIRELPSSRSKLRERRAGRVVVAVLDRHVEPRQLCTQTLTCLGLQARRQVTRRRAVHPGDLHVAAERDRADPVLDTVADGLDDRRPEAEVELPRRHPHGARREEVPRLVDHHEHRQPEDGRD